MPLINLKTNLKSLKFGVGTASDRPGGGYSNQPYIIKDIPSDSSDPSNVFNTGGTDSLLRGGLIAPIKAVNDVSRLTQMFFDTRSPNGLLFTTKQNVLSRTSVETEASIGPGTAGGTVNQGVYLPTSTIAQAGVGFLGAHGNLLGLNPLSPGGNDPSLSDQISNAGLVKYEQAALANNARDVGILNIEEDVYTPPPGSGVVIQSEAVVTAPDGGYGNRLLKIWHEKQDQTSEDSNIITYSGGPGSILGIGKTNIKFAGQSSRDRTGINNPLTVTDPDYFLKGNHGNKGKENKISQRVQASGYKVGYNESSRIDQRVNRGNPGKKNVNIDTGLPVMSYTLGIGEALDKINALPPYSSTTPNHAEHNDLVKFSIGILNNDGSGNSTYTHFRSFINSFDDAYSADWGETQYVGRGDKFYNYKGFNRQISMGWTTYAQSREELIPMYKKLNYLASSLAPDYSTSGGFMRGNLARLTVGGYLYNQLGIIKSITYTIPQESTWEVAIDDFGNFTDSLDNAGGNTQVRELAHMITVSGFTFIPIEDTLPKIGSQFIALQNAGGVVRNYEDPLKYSDVTSNSTISNSTISNVAIGVDSIDSGT